MRRCHFAIAYRLDHAAAIALILAELVLQPVGGVRDMAVMTATLGF